MKYTSLKQYFYMHPEEIEEEYSKRFGSDEAVQIGIELNNKPAFLYNLIKTPQNPSIREVLQHRD